MTVPRDHDMRQLFNSIMHSAYVFGVVFAFAFVFSLKAAFAFDGARSATSTEGIASWYSTEACKFNPDPKCPTAHGESLYELENQGTLFAAKWDVPFGTRVKVTNRKNGKSVVVSILDRGPARRLSRSIDLCKEAFGKLTDVRKGVIYVRIEVV